VGRRRECGARLAACTRRLGALALFYVLLRTTWLGLAFRAASQNRVGAETAGVNVLRLDQLAFGIGVALAGLAGALLAPVFFVYPTNGIVTTTKGFEIIVIGGLRPLPGALLARGLLGAGAAPGPRADVPPPHKAHRLLP